MRKKLTWTFFILGIVTFVATVSLLRYDHKEKSWYNEKFHKQKQHNPDTTAIVCILATVHQPSSKYNADSIVAILSRFQPDLILTEEDTLLFEAVHKRYNETLKRPLFAKLVRSFGFGSPEENEYRAVRKYKINHPAVEIRPFDYEGRNAFYNKSNTFVNEAEVSSRLESLASSHLLTQEHAKIWSTYQRINDTLDHFSHQTPSFINQQTYYDLTERRQAYQYHKVAEIVNGNDSLQSYRPFYKSNADFWDTRNKKMAEHISNFIRQHPNKRIIVLTGSMHKYYLLKELVPLQGKLAFRLNEYYY